MANLRALSAPDVGHIHYKSAVMSAVDKHFHYILPPGVQGVRCRTMMMERSWYGSPESLAP